MIIQQYKRSPIAMAPNEIAKCINKYTRHTSFVDSVLHPEADFIHFHNKSEFINLPQAITYHSEPEKVNLNYKYSKSVIAQYHATLPEYAGCVPVRNIIDFYQESFNFYSPEKIRIGFSPSKKMKSSEWNDKGYRETRKILEKVGDLMDVEIDIISGVSLEEVIERKQKCSIIIDECKTKSYHRSALEGLALGKMTICSIGEDVQEVVKNITGQYLPVENVDISRLETFLIEVVEKFSAQDLAELGKNRRSWMETYWNPKDVIVEYLNLYGVVYAK